MADVDPKTMENQHFPSKFLRWFAKEFGRPMVPDQPEDEAAYRAWMAGYNCCYQERVA